jgi:hypothetical protein
MRILVVWWESGTVRNTDSRTCHPTIHQVCRFESCFGIYVRSERKRFCRQQTTAHEGPRSPRKLADLRKYKLTPLPRNNTKRCHRRTFFTTTRKIDETYTTCTTFSRQRCTLAAKADYMDSRLNDPVWRVRTCCRWRPLESTLNRQRAGPTSSALSLSSAREMLARTSNMANTERSDGPADPRIKNNTMDQALTILAFYSAEKRSKSERLKGREFHPPGYST